MPNKQKQLGGWSQFPSGDAIETLTRNPSIRPRPTNRKHPAMTLVDPYGRIIDYLRISHTDSCNRLRLTDDGKIHTCLFYRNEIDVKTPPHRGVDRQELMTLFHITVANKPRRHELDGQSRNQMRDRGMCTIGG